MKRRFPFLLIILFLLSSLAQAGNTTGKKGYDLKFRVRGLKDTVVYLANYFGEKTYLSDTAIVDGSGRFEFSKKEPLPGGIYIVAQGRNKLFEFIIDQSQFFSLETEGPEYIMNMKIKNSPENQDFFDYLMFNGKKYVESEPFQKVLKNKNASKDSTDLARQKLTDLNKEVEDYKVKFIAEHPGAFLAHFFKSLKEPVIPEAPLKPDGKRDSAYVYNYYKDHYWDNIELTDERLLRTPTFHNRLNQYFDKVLLQIPDTIIAESERLIAKVKTNKEMFKYFVWYVTTASETSSVMGMDRVFVYMVETYYMTNQAYWVNPTVLENITKRAKELKPILIGEIAPNMIMLDTSMQIVSMHALKNRYVILYFWDPECSHCKVEGPKLKKFYDENKAKYDLQVFAVCSDTNMKKMKEYIKSAGYTWINVNGPRSVTPNYHNLYDIKSTPVIFLLDDKKTILAKKLLPEQLANFLERYDESIKKGGKPPHN